MRPIRAPLTSLLVLLPVLLHSPPLAAQTADSSLTSLVLRLAGMTAVTGYEQAMADSLRTLLPGATRDRAGNVVRGAAGPGRTLLACPLDEPGWVVGGVRPDGYLTLRRSPGGLAPDRDAQLEGARVAVHGRRGVLPGVVAVRSIHLTRGREVAEVAFTSDSAYLDLGAGNAGEVARLGVGVLSVVTLAKRPHRYGSDLLAAPVAGRRAACAALLDAARAVESGRAVVAFVVEQELTQRGLATLGHASGPFSRTVVVDGGLTGWTADSSATLPGLGTVTRLELPVRYPDTPVETISLADVARLRAEIAALLESAR